MLPSDINVPQLDSKASQSDSPQIRGSSVSLWLRLDLPFFVWKPFWLQSSYHQWVTHPQMATTFRLNQPASLNVG